MIKWLDNWKEIAEELEKQVFALYLAFRHPRTPWYAKALALAVTAYTLSPIDLIPDFIPVLGYLDDLVIVPLGIFLVIKMVPPEVMAECQSRAAGMEAPQLRWMGPVVVFLWLVALAVVVTVVVKIIQR